MSRIPLFHSWTEDRCRTAGGWALLVLLILLATTPSAVAQQDFLETDPVFSEGWERIGSFKGSTSSRLWQRVNDMLFEQEAGGALYRDLGDVTLGLGYSTDDVELDWDNSFFRRVLPLHQELPRGSLVTGDDLSRYLDLQTLISRGRFSYNYVPGFAESFGGIGIRVEGGTSLTLGRIHHPLKIGGRPLAEALDDPGCDLEAMTRALPEDGNRSLVRLSTEGLGGLVRWISGKIGDRVVDTEQSAIFFEHYADPMTLFIDLDIPVEAALFTADDTRLGSGDLVRHVTFIGLVPLAVGVEKYGIRANYSYYFRLFRETTIVKEGDGHVVVGVRTALSRGNELTPLKVRPEVRILGILKLGYTFYELLYGNGRGPVYDVTYRINLNDERGMASFKALLGEGTRVKFKPLAEAAEERDGAEILHTEARRAKDRYSFNRLRFFGLLKKTDRQSSSSDIVVSGDNMLLEIVRTRRSNYVKNFGKRKRKTLSFFARSQSDLINLDQGDPLPRKLDPQRLQGDQDVTAVTLLTSVRDDYADGRAVRWMAGILDRTLDWDPQPVLDELTSVDPDLQTRFVTNFRLSLNREHFERIATAETDQVWTELAQILLGDDHRDAWSSAEKRKTWKRDVRQQRRSTGEPPVFNDLGLKASSLSPRKRLRLARRAVKKFGHLQELARGSDSLKYLARSMKSWWDITAMQTLMVRLGRRDGAPEVGYHYEVFTDEMLRPVTVTNGITYEHHSRLGIANVMEAVLADERGVREQGVGALEQEHIRGGRQWKGDQFVEPSSSRLKGGDLLINTGAEPESGALSPPCWKLRLYSDLQYEEGLTLRADLREDGGIKADSTLGFSSFELGEPTAIEDTPFMTARYYYDIPLPEVEAMESGQSYVILLRILNDRGLPVSEEQQVRFNWPAGGLDLITGCNSPALHH